MNNLKSKKVLYSVLLALVAILFCAVILILCTRTENNTTEILADVRFTAYFNDNTNVTITPFYDESTDEISLFIPVWADGSTIEYDGTYSLTVNGKTYRKGDSISFEGVGATVQVCLSQGNRTVNESEWTVSTLSCIPSMFITTASGSMDKIYANKKYDETGSMTILTPEGAADYVGALTKISGRGNTTWGLDKKPFSIALEESYGLLGMRESTEWVLLANYIDGSFLRNVIAYNAAQICGMTITSNTYPVDLYLNGQYAGLYLLCEKVNADQYYYKDQPGTLVVKNVLSRAESSKNLYFTTTYNSTFVLEDSNNANLELCNSLEQYFDLFEEALYSEDGYNTTGKYYSDYIDIQSFAIQYMISEVLGNQDANIASEYYYIDENDGLLHAGPMWDFDLSLGNGCLSIQYPQSIIAAADGRGWYEQLVRYDDFNQCVSELYANVLYPYICETTLNQIDILSSQISASALADSIRWQNFEKSFYQRDCGDFKEQVVYMEGFLRERAAFLYDYWVLKNNFVTVRLSFNVPNQRDVYLKLTQGETIDWSAFLYNGYELKSLKTEDGDDWSEDMSVTEDVSIQSNWAKAETAKSTLERYWPFIPILVMGAFTVVILIRNIGISDIRKRN